MSSGQLLPYYPYPLTSTPKKHLFNTQQRFKAHLVLVSILVGVVFGIIQSLSPLRSLAPALRPAMFWDKKLPLRNGLFSLLAETS
jgi:hypothetical protein